MYSGLATVIFFAALGPTIHGGPISGYTENSIPPPCDSPIYCYGDLLHTVQLAEIFEDSKTFVDLRQKYSPNETLQRFDDFIQQTGGRPTKSQVSAFVNETFESGDELAPWNPTDWVESPKFFSDIYDESLRQWASDLNRLWLALGRKIKEDVKSNQEQYSLIYVPNGFIIPGGRFKEFYYWDTYWIVRGLLLCEMTTTVKGILENFLTFVDDYGFIPNGGRVYYLERSQPPLLIPMVMEYVRASRDVSFILDNYALLEKEYNFWIVNRTVDVKKNGKTYKMAHFDSECSGPRPESYRQDYQNAQFFKTSEEQLSFYINTKSAAESGWDFSSRWFIKDGTNQGNLTDLSTVDVVPVDLNSFLYRNAVILMEMAWILGKQEKMKFYYDEANRWKEAVQDVFWNDDAGIWQDYDIKNNVNREQFYPSNLAPLWAGCYNREQKESISTKVVQYIKSSGILDYKGGIPTTVEHTGEQWDFPNAWPPLQDIVIQGLSNLQEPAAEELALTLATNWVRANYIGFNNTNEMFEKYDARTPGDYGGGGEYTVQAGFGWTNGVILELLSKYGKQIQLTDPIPNYNVVKPS